MNTVVNRLLDVDRDARRILDDAQQYYDKTMEEIEAEKEKMVGYYEEKERQRIEDVTKIEEGNILEATSKIEKQYGALTDKIDGTFLSKRESWEEELFLRCAFGDDRA